MSALAAPSDAAIEAAADLPGGGMRRSRVKDTLDAICPRQEKRSATMSWECPYQDSKTLTCERLKGTCKPLAPGCILHGKVEHVADTDEAKPKRSAPKPPPEPDRGQ